MEIKAVASILIFIITVFLVIKRPKGLNIGVTATIGAGLSLLFGTVTVFEAVEALSDIWDAALAFFGIIMLSLTLDAMGFFKWAALKIIGYAKGNGKKLYIYIALLTAAVSILFANDSAILILTPIVVEITHQLNFKGGSRLVYLFAAGFVADTAAMPLITSNPVNIVSADFFKYTFIDHLIFMGPVSVVTVVFSILVVYLFFKNKIPVVYEAQNVNLDCSLIAKSNV
ncbi:MAG: ArsB/NhaD family transporter, partial [Candidatus Odinarchaeota archaeon]